MAKVYLKDGVQSLWGNYNISGAKTAPGSRVKSIVAKLANDRSNKLESSPFEGLNEKIEEVFYNSDITRIRLRLGKELSMFGKRAIGVFPHRDGYLIDMFTVISSKSIGIWEMEATLDNGMLMEIDGNEIPVLHKYYLEGGKAMLKTFYHELDEDGKPTDVEKEIESFTFPNLDKIPVEIFYANSDNVSDVQFAGVEDDLLRLNVIDSEFVEQYNLSKAMPFYNETFTDNDPAQETAELKAGRGYMKESSMQSQLGAGTQLIPASTATTVLQVNILFLEDDIYKKLGLKRDLNSSTNSHTVEVITSDENVIEMTEALRLLRESHWNHLIDKMAMLLGVTQEPIELGMSVVDKAKWDWFTSQMIAESAKGGTPEEEQEEPEAEEPIEEDVEQDAETTEEVEDKDPEEDK